MKRALNNTILALCIFLVSVFPTQSFAMLEERNDPFGGTGSITYDTETGLEWLDVDLINRSQFFRCFHSIWTRGMNLRGFDMQLIRKY